MAKGTDLRGSKGGVPIKEDLIHGGKLTRN